MHNSQVCACRRSLACVAIMLLLAACTEDGDGGSAMVAVEAGAVPWADAGQFPVTPPLSTPMQSPGTMPPLATPGTPGQPADAGTTGVVLVVPDAGQVRDAGPIVVTIPTRAVACGASDCTTTNNRTCCQGWNKGMGFMGSPACTTVAACTSDHSIFGDTNRAVMSDCDEPGDCSGGQVCCFVRYGRPITADLFSADVVGPGASRLCMELSACNAGMTTITGVAGVPVGLVSCKSNADCRDGAQCVPESNDSVTTGKGGSARPGVMVCK